MPLPTTRARLPVTLGVLRSALGATMLVRPMLLPRPLGVDRITADRISWLVRMLGARDLALGVGTLVATRRGGLPPWLVLAGAADTVDALALGQATARGDVGRVLGTLAALAGAGGAALSAIAYSDQRTAEPG
ncbi:MAG: hypothetical protein QOG53_2762 [Frankiales bacterium]|nr:hypothetical protein [Frankiales bacterium]